MSSIEDALTYPTESDDWIVTVIIGGVLFLLSILIIPMFLVYGYLIRAIRSSLDGEPEPPTFGDWGELLVDGIQAAVIVFLYMLIPLIVMFVTIGGAIMAIATGSEAGAATGLGGLMVGMLVTFLLMLFFGYLSAVGIVNFAHEDRFGAAFDFGTIRDVGFDSDFAVPWLVSVGVFLVAGIVSNIPVIGFIVGVFVNFYALTVAANLWAGGFTDATDTTSPQDSTGVEETIA